MGIEAHDDPLDKLIAALKDKNINELIAQGTFKIVTIPNGVGSGAGAPIAMDTSGKVGEASGKDPNSRVYDSDRDYVSETLLSEICYRGTNEEARRAAHITPSSIDINFFCYEACEFGPPPSHSGANPDGPTKYYGLESRIFSPGNRRWFRINH